VGSPYKYHIVSKHGGYRVDKADPYGFCHEVSPRTAAVVAELWHNWGDQTWMAERARRNALAALMAIYEIHLGFCGQCLLRQPSSRVRCANRRRGM
jgi:1,4-alpha-glucan branching enzyme